MNLIQEAFGAQILQAQCDVRPPIFYISPISIKGAPRRGGVPVLFPQFADRGPFVKHGFARNLPWSSVEGCDEGELKQDFNSHYCLYLAPGAISGWDHHARLDLMTRLSTYGLVITLKVTNFGATAFSWTGGLHPYFYVDDVLRAKLFGLASSSLIDRYDPLNTIDQNPSITFDENPCEKLYQVNLPIQLKAGGQILNLSSTGFSEWMIWNPGRLYSAHLADLPDGDWRHFICVEPVNVTNPIIVEPSEEFLGSLSISY